MVKVREPEGVRAAVEAGERARVEVDHVRFAARRIESGLYRHEAQKFVFELRSDEFVRASWSRERGAQGRTNSSHNATRP